MIEKAVIYNTIDRTGICPEEVFNRKELPLCVFERVDLTREQMKELFYLWDLDHMDWTNKFWEKLVGYLHSKILGGVKNDLVITLKNDKVISKEVKILNYNPDSEKHLPANIKYGWK